MMDESPDSGQLGSDEKSTNEESLLRTDERQEYVRNSRFTSFWVMLYPILFEWTNFVIHKRAESVIIMFRLII